MQARPSFIFPITIIQIFKKEEGYVWWGYDEKL